jgi:hypothetical protein
VPLRTLLFVFGLILENPRFITCYDMFEKIFIILDVFKKVQAHIPSVFLLFISEVFWNELCTNFLNAQFLGQNVLDGWVIQIQLTTNYSVKRRSDLMRAHTLVTFSSVFEVQGLTEQDSSSIHLWPSKNALCHLKTCAVNRACSP